jgi:hypothetical protein
LFFLQHRKILTATDPSPADPKGPLTRHLGGLTIVQQSFSHYCRLDISGPPVLRDLLNLIDAVHAESQQCRLKKLLADVTRLEGSPDTVGQALVGEHIGVSLAHLARIATVVAPGMVTHISESVARKHGANLTVFSDEAEAIQWLAA